MLDGPSKVTPDDLDTRSVAYRRNFYEDEFDELFSALTSQGRAFETERCVSDVWSRLRVSDLSL